MSTKSRAKRRAARRHHPPSELMLAAMVDMMVNLLIFLLHLYGTTPVDVQMFQDLVLPESTSRTQVEPAVNVIVSKRAISVDGERVLTLTDGVLPEGATRDGRVEALAEVLENKAAKAIPLPGTPEMPAGARPIVLQVDKTLSWTVLAPIVGTVGDAGFGRIKFIVQEGKPQ